LHPTPESVVSSVGVGIALATLYVCWVTYLDARKAKVDNRDATIVDISDQLALAVGEQWTREAQIRRLYDPYPLPVAWTPTDAPLVDNWQVLLAAASSDDWPLRAPEAGWATCPKDLEGEGGELAGVLGRVPTGRLVVLGEPGSGKTMLMIRLVLDLIARRTSRDPVPVLVPVASWDPTKEDLYQWLAVRLAIDYPSLSGPTPIKVGHGTCIEGLLRRHLILPILDGVDEIPDELRPAAIAAINNSLIAGDRLVITCRLKQYRDAAIGLHCPRANIRLAAGILLCPLSPNVIVRYLRDDIGASSTQDIWADLHQAIAENFALRTVLATPLMVSLARAIYNPGIGPQVTDPPDPAALLTLHQQSAIEDYLFSVFISAAYRPTSLHIAKSKSWTAKQAEYWLAFLAHHLEDVVKTPDFAWWELRKVSIHGVWPGSGPAEAV